LRGGCRFTIARVVLLVLAAAASAVAARAADGSASSRLQDSDLGSTALAGRLHFEVYLPRDYDRTRTRYPVLYFLHGLPSGAAAYTSLGFVEHALDSLRRPAILVVPQGARGGEPDPEYLDRGTGDRWETAIVRELPRAIDSRFRTIPARRGRALIGVSAGGYGAMHLGLQHLREFSVLESWSGYFHPTDPSGTRPLELGSAASDARADVHLQLGAARLELRRLPTFIAFYVGRGDRRFYAENEALNRELSTEAIPHTFRAYQGAHDQRLWRRYAAPWLALALSHLAGASVNP
jgi:enterochelin esterase-like enzyme